MSGRLAVVERGAVIEVRWRWGGHPVRVGIVVVVVVLLEVLGEVGRREKESTVAQ